MDRDDSAKVEQVLAPLLPVLSIRQLSKRFGGLLAVDRVDFDLYPGEIVGFLGDNGAGKSTLIKMISGVYRPDSGKILSKGYEVRFNSPLEARRSGIETIYQDLALCENLDASANIFLGREVMRWGRLNTSFMLKEARYALEQLDIEIPNLRRPIRQMSGGQRQAIAIARAIYWQARMVIMDEPTAALGVPEQQKVLALIHKLAEKQVPVILISHNMQDVFEVTQRLMVMRRGQKVGERLTAETDQRELVSLMVGA